MNIRLHVKYPPLLSDFNKNLIFSIDFHKSSNIKFHRKSVYSEPICSTRTDGQTDMTKVTVAFRNFAKAPNTVFLQLTVFLTDNFLLVHIIQTFVANSGMLTRSCHSCNQ